MYTRTTEGARPLGRAPSSSPLYYMGDGGTAGKTNLGWSGRGGWTLTCDKLRLMWVLPPTAEVSRGVIGAAFGAVHNGRRRGAYSCAESRAWAEVGAAPIMWAFRRYEGVASPELRCEFSPWKATEGTWMAVWGTLALYGLLDADPWVERFDVAWDRVVDPYRYRLDPGLHKADAIGLTSRGAETERFGYRKGVKTKVKKYNKGLERRRKGERGVADSLRYEVECWEPRLTVDGSAGPAAAAAADDPGCRLSRLADVVCPIPAGTGLVELVRDPDAYGDVRFLALGCVALQMGPQAARRAAREILGGDGAGRFDGVFWEDQTDRLRAVFDAGWGCVVAAMRAAMRPQLGTASAERLSDKRGGTGCGSGGASSGLPLPAH